MNLLKIFKRDTPLQVRKEPRFHRRSYGGAKKTRFNADWITSTTSSDAELRGGLRVLRNRSRSLVRDNSYAKRIRDLLQGNIVGQGIGLQCVRTDTGGRRMDRENDLIEQQWWLWANGDGCHVSGLLSLTDILRLAVGEVFEAGEVLIRFVPQAFGHSKVPMAIEVIEAERLVDSQTTVTLPNGNTARMGVEMDSCRSVLPPLHLQPLATDAWRAVDVNGHPALAGHRSVHHERDGSGSIFGQRDGLYPEA